MGGKQLRFRGLALDLVGEDLAALLAAGARRDGSSGAPRRAGRGGSR